MKYGWERYAARAAEVVGSLPKEIPPYEFITDHCFLTSNGWPVVVLNLNPSPYECLDGSSLARNAHVFRTSERILYPEMRLYLNVRKHELLDPEEIPADRLLHVHRSREGPLFSIESYIAICYEFERSKNKYINPRRGASSLDLETRAHAVVLEDIANGFIRALAPAVKAELCDQRDSFLFLRKQVNYDRAVQDTLLHFPWELNHQMCSTDLNIHEEILMIGRYTTSMMTLKRLPASSVDPDTGEVTGGTFPGMLNRILEVPAQFNICMEWKRSTSQETSKEIQSRKDHFQLTKHALVSTASSDQAADGAKQQDLRDLTKAQADLRGANRSGIFSLTAVVYGESTSKVRSGFTAFKTVFDDMGCLTSNHTGVFALASFLGTIPGNRHWSTRGIRIKDENLADVALLYGPPCGNPWNDHLKAPALTQFATSQNTVYNFNLHRGQAGHGLIIGMIRSGKTYFGKLLLKEADERYSPYVVVLDVASSFETLVRNLGGSYVQLGGRSASINPFALPPTDRNLNFLNRFVRMLIESDGTGSLNAKETEDVNQQILDLYQLDSKYRRLEYLRLHPGTLAPRLARWQDGGQYAHLFDNETDSIEDTRIQAFSFPGMENDREAFDAVLFYALHRSLESIYSTDRPSFVLMDESATFLRVPSIRDYVLEALRKWPKMNASMTIIGHSISDMGVDVARAIAEKCFTQVYFPNPGIDKAAWRAAFQLSEVETDHIAEMREQRQFLIKGQGVFNLIVGPEEHKVLETGMEKAIV